MSVSVHNLRQLRPVPDPIPWYVRVGYNDHRFLEDKLSAGDTRLNRAVFDAVHIERHKPLLDAMQRRNAELVLDTRAAELVMPVGQKDALRKLAWADSAGEPDASSFDDSRCRAVSQQIADHALEYGFTAVLAPTHFLSGTGDFWVNIDAKLTLALRRALDEAGGRHVRIYYPLLIPYSWLSVTDSMRSVTALLASLPIDAVWIRVSNFRNDKSPSAVRNYIEGARVLLSAGKPVIADHVGGISALAILAFGAAGGIAHGIGTREQFAVSNWQNRQSKGFGVPTRAYSADTDLYLSKKNFGAVLENLSIRSRLICKNKNCCPRGVDDMFGNAKRHIVNARLDQLAELARSTDSQRAGTFLRRVLMPIGANLIKLDHALQNHPELQVRIQEKRKFIDNLRLVLEDLRLLTQTDVPRSQIPRRAAFSSKSPISPEAPRPRV